VRGWLYSSDNDTKWYPGKHRGINISLLLKRFALAPFVHYGIVSLLEFMENDMSIDNRMVQRINNLALSNNTAVKEVTEGDTYSGPEIILENDISIVYESSSDKPWEIYHEHKPGDFISVGRCRSPDALMHSLNEQLSKMATTSNNSNQGFNSEMSFASRNTLSAH